MSPQAPTKGKIIVFGIIFWYPSRRSYVPISALSHWFEEAQATTSTTLRTRAGGSTIPSNLNSRPTHREMWHRSRPILEAHGFAGRWAFRGNYPEGRCYGMSEDQILRLYREADAVLNVTASQELREEHMAIPRRVYVESDPVRDADQGGPGR